MDSLHERLDAIRARLAETSPAPWTVETGGEGARFVRTGQTDGEDRLFVRHDLAPAPDGDVAFIALARNVLERLVDALDGNPHSISPEELDEIQAAADGATRGPWTPFIEERQPIGGSSVIWVGGDDFDADMYLWLGDDMAPGELFDFVAYARQDVPWLVDEIRRRQGNE
jgi:hypothetical protein